MHLRDAVTACGLVNGDHARLTTPTAAAAVDVLQGGREAATHAFAAVQTETAAGAGGERCPTATSSSSCTMVVTVGR